MFLAFCLIEKPVEDLITAAVIIGKTVPQYTCLILCDRHVLWRTTRREHTGQELETGLDLIFMDESARKYKMHIKPLGEF